MTSGTIILNALRRKWTPTKRSDATTYAAGGMLNIVLPPQWPESGGAIHWHWRHPNGATEQGVVAKLDELVPAARGTPAQIWTPARETLLTRARIPTRSSKKIMQALPYVLEDLLLEEPEKLDFAYVRDSAGDLVVAVTSKLRVTAWRAALQAAGLRVVRVLPAFFAVPNAPGAWSAGFMGPELLVRTGLMEGFSCPATASRPPPVLVHALSEARANNLAPQQIVLYRPPHPLEPETWQDALGLAIAVEPKQIWDEPNTPPAGLTLYRAEGSSGLSSLVAPLRAFLPAATLLLIWFIGSLAFDLTEWWSLRRNYNRVTTEMHDIFRRAFPEAKTILDPARQMQSELARLQRATSGSADGDFLLLLEQLAGAIRARADVTIRAVNYRDQQLTIELTAANSEVVDQIKRSLDSGGGRTQILGTTKRADHVEARLRLAPSGNTGRKS